MPPILAIAVLGAVLATREFKPGSPEGPVVQILEPVDGIKLHPGRVLQVRIRVTPRESPIRSWALELAQEQTGTRLLAHGSAAVDDRAVAHVRWDELGAGRAGTLTLIADDVAGVRQVAISSMFVPDSLYMLIPFEEGNLSRAALGTLGMDRSGRTVAFGGRPGDPSEIHLADLAVGARSVLRLALSSNEALKLSGDGQRLVFRDGNWLAVLPLSRQEPIQIARTGANLFSVDYSARWIAFQSQFDLDPGVGNPDRTLQYFLYDDLTKEVRQLTDDPDAIVYDTRPEACPRILATIPLIDGLGSRVVLITNVTLGLLGTDPSVGCRIFRYDVGEDRLRHVVDLRRAISLGNPTLSADGRWLSFTSSRTIEGGIRRAFPALLDLETEELTDPVGSLTDFPSFDSVVSGDGNTIVISTQADVDPRVGNADHNMELFAYDRETGTFTQITDTIGGIGRTPGGCPSYRPRLSQDARRLAFFFIGVGGEKCRPDGPQRNEVDGLNLGRVRAVRKRPDNNGPAFQPAASARVIAGQKMQLTFTATDPDDDPITFFAQLVGGMDVPPGSEIEDHRDGTATFTWPTRTEHVGMYDMRVAAFDEGGGEVFHDIQLAVWPAHRQRRRSPGVLSSLFRPDPPPPCRDADRNQDGRITAADVVAARVDA
jgi:hypothetical protein